MGATRRPRVGLDIYSHPHHSTHERVATSSVGITAILASTTNTLGRHLKCLRGSGVKPIFLAHSRMGCDKRLRLKGTFHCPFPEYYQWLNMAFGGVCKPILFSLHNLDVYRPMSQHTTLVFRRGGTMCWDYNGLVGLTIGKVVGLSEGLFTPPP